MNIEHRQWVRVVRRARRSHFSCMWGDISESRHHQVEDIFDLRRLFGEEPYDNIEKENWNIEKEEETSVSGALESDTW